MRPTQQKMMCSVRVSADMSVKHDAWKLRCITDLQIKVTMSVSECGKLCTCAILSGLAANAVAVLPTLERPTYKGPCNLQMETMKYTRLETFNETIRN